MLDVEFEHVEFPPKCDILRQDSLGFVPDRAEPLNEATFQHFLDHDGRLVDEHGLKKAVFRGGVEPALRKSVWQFVFGLYPCMTTTRERQVLFHDYQIRYKALRDKWKKTLVWSAETGDPKEQGITASYLQDKDVSDAREEALSSDGQQKQFIEIQAQVYAERQSMTSIAELREYIRVIDKDVPRTDREHKLIRDGGVAFMKSLRDCLITYAAFHPSVGYTQGMNDIVCRFLVVFDSEVEAYWSFANYMENIQKEFLETGMIEKVDFLKQLLIELDPDLFTYLNVNCESGDLVFCHRWLLLGFKREFSFDDSLRCFEILSSQHLEMSSMEAEHMRLKAIQKDYEQQGGKMRTATVDARREFTFELFMCVAILILYRENLFQCDDPPSVFQCISSLSNKMNLDTILCQAEYLFFKYCKKTVMDCFQVVDQPTARKKRNSPLSFVP